MQCEVTGRSLTCKQNVTSRNETDRSVDRTWSVLKSKVCEIALRYEFIAGAVDGQKVQRPRGFALKFSP